MLERKPYTLWVEYPRVQKVTVYAETEEDAIDIAAEAAQDGELENYAPEPSMSGKDDQQAELMYPGGYDEGGDVRIMVGPIDVDVVHVYVDRD